MTKDAKPIQHRFQRTVRALCIGLITSLQVSCAYPQSEDAESWLIQNITLIDGTGSAPRDASVRIQGDRIEEVGNLLHPSPGETVLDGKGLVLSPGFIDTHSHHDRGMFKTPELMAVTSQGVTTIIVGQDGFSNLPLGTFYDKLASQPVAVNVGSYTGHNTLRAAAIDTQDLKKTAKPDALEGMQALLRSDMDQGSFGLSSGLGYETGIFSDLDELLGLAEILAETGGRYISHMRDENTKMVSAIEEVIAISRETGIPVQVSHLKIGTRMLWGTSDIYLNLLNEARAEGIDITADVYPYTYWQTTMRILFPNKDYSDPRPIKSHFTDTLSPSGLIIQKFLPDPSLENKTVAEIAKEKAMDPVDLYMQLMQQVLAYEVAHPDAGHIESIIGTSMSEEDVINFLMWPHSNICSDGADGGHPRGYGSFTRILGHYVRETKALTLSDAVHKMSGLAAAHLGIETRGLIKKGYMADLVLFDPDTVADMATVKEPKALSKGIHKVWVNGALVYADGQPTMKHPGQIIKASQE